MSFAKSRVLLLSSGGIFISAEMDAALWGMERMKKWDGNRDQGQFSLLL